MVNKVKNDRFFLSTTHVIMLSFVVAVLVGSLVLALPISSANGRAIPYVDALFTSATATCVTGLVTLPTFSAWSVFGQAVILILIQIGGLGIITVMSAVLITLNKKMGLNDRILIQDTFNLNSMSGIVRFVRRVVMGTFVVEGIGAVFYMAVFVPEFGLRGIWISVFTSVSAFCNAGIDIIGTESLCAYALSPAVNIITSALIIIGGIGFIVWWDIGKVLKKIPKMGFTCFNRLTLHSKITLVTTGILIIAGAASIFAFEYSNPSTMGNMTFSQKIMASLFQSVTARTAGFAAVPQECLTDASSVVMLVLMFIGGSPVGTAGGIKTVTAAVLFISAVSSVKNRDEVSAFGRAISEKSVRKASAVASMAFVIVFLSTVMLSCVTDGSVIDILYETVSATATVGLTRGITSELCTFGKLIITFTMYLGRVGPISLAVAFITGRENKNLIKNPTEEISIG